MSTFYIIFERRAESVKKFLVAQGVKSHVLDSIGYGESAPRYEIKKMEDKRSVRENNRRVEFKVQGKDLRVDNSRAIRKKIGLSSGATSSF